MSEEWGAWIKELLDYNPSTGSLIWLSRGANKFSSESECFRWNTRYAHTKALCTKNKKGYLSGTIGGRGYLSHRVAWFLFYGAEPPEEIDHVNGIRDDNRISNLRSADRVVNCRNQFKRIDNTSGHTGVTKSGARWLARIGSGKSRVTLGVFQNIDDAIEARKVAEMELKYSTRHGTDA